MKFAIQCAGYPEPVTLQTEPGRVVVCGVAYLPHEARKLAQALARCATAAQDAAESDLETLAPEV